MRSKPLYWMGAIALITLTLYSCQKDNEVSETIPTNPTTTNNPTTTHQEPAVDVIDVLFEDEVQAIIGPNEIKGSIKAKALVRDIIKESFMQLILNHDLNPLMPLNQRTNCPSCPDEWCGCPIHEYVTDTLSGGGGTYPAIINLHYQDQSTCSACTSPLSGLDIGGSIVVMVSDPLGTMGHTITILPSDNFTIDGHDLDADVIQLTNQFIDGSATPPESYYTFTGLSNMRVVNPSNDTTTFVSLDQNFSFLKITDTGTNHGNFANGFGLLDDVYSLDLVDLVVECSNGQQVTESTTESLIYDMTCDCIQDGIVEMVDPNLVDLSATPPVTGVVAIYDYGYNAAGNPGECDDKILMTIPGCSIVDPNSAVVRTGATVNTVIDCL